MNAFWGADTDQLVQHATAMHTAAQRLVELQEQLSSLVMDEAIWRGSDADSFRERWQSDALQASERVAGDIDTKADEVQGHASEQDGASGEGGIGGALGAAGGAVGGGGAAGWGWELRASARESSARERAQQISGARLRFGPHAGLRIPRAVFARPLEQLFRLRAREKGGFCGTALVWRAC